MRLRVTIAAILIPFSIAGTACASGPAGLLESGSAQSDDCASYRAIKDPYDAYISLLEEYKAKYPFVFDLTFKEKVHLYDHGWGSTYRPKLHDLEVQYLMGQGPIPDSIKDSIKPPEPFSELELDWLAHRSEWEGRLDFARNDYWSLQSELAALWPHIENSDLKEILKSVALAKPNDWTRELVSADSICPG
jgi:hypothetical protein